ncbi:MAG: methyltransferase domain-containing protein [Gaiellaceae bacterium]
MPPRCRLCSAALTDTFVDLGASPLANSYLDQAQLATGEMFYPLHVRVCAECLLVQLPELASPTDIFSQYAYFSSYSDSWVEHARQYVELVAERFGLDGGSRVVEIASNDGYLLQFFQAKGVPVLGVEPAANVAAVAQRRGIATLVDFFGRAVAERLRDEGHGADLIVGNNVLAHVPDAHDFVEGLRCLLEPGGVVTMEFPHLLRLVQERQFDTIYHEHFSYFSLRCAERLFAAHELVIFDVDELSTHGGSLRIYAGHAGGPHSPTEHVADVHAKERRAGLDELGTYLEFGETAREAKRDLLAFLVDAKRSGLSVVGYGAAAKGVTLLNFCGIGGDFIDYVVDRSPHKQGRFLPGVRLPIYPPEHTRRTRPDVLLVLPWNLADEIGEQMAFVRDWGCKLVLPIPEVTVLD